ncbi:MAG: alginate lyase family protein [Hyphomicrobiaceae bacterium]
MRPADISIGNALRLFHTVRHLKPAQIVGRAQAKLRRVVPDPTPAPKTRLPLGHWVATVSRAASLKPGFQVRFLNEDGEIKSRAQWNDPGKAKLWLYNLHYFDDLCAGDGYNRRGLQRELIARWIEENPPGDGNGWEPYPVSLRIVNWVKWALSGETLDAKMRDSLAMQVSWLTHHIEWHLLGNHLLANAKALVFAGLYFDGPEADRWLDQGIAIYTAQLKEQILDDGAHFELSPMYHAIILEDLLDLINLSRHYGSPNTEVFQDLPDLTRRMRYWLAAMTHRDGNLSFFNDAAVGIAGKRDDIEAYAMRLQLGPVAGPGEGVHHLAASGYVRVNCDDMTAILDLASVGPDYLPGHAHADTLSFELTLGNERLIVNGGTSTYAPGGLREAERATAAHSTVEIDGENSSEVWASFRVARRARVANVVIQDNGSDVMITASHDGYSRLPGRPLHYRTWYFSPVALKMVDRILGVRVPDAIARFHLGHGVSSTIEQGSHQGVLTTSSNRSVHWKSSEPVAIDDGNWAREFGCRLPTSTLLAPLRSGRLDFGLEWQR